MKRFRVITAVCLTAIAIMVAGNVWYLYGLYNTIKGQALQTVSECVRRAYILEIITRFHGASQGMDDSFIRMTLMVQGEKTESGGYDYPNLLGNIGQTMSSYFHFVEQSDTRMADRNYAVLDSIFRKELASAGLNPEVASIRPGAEGHGNHKDLWHVELAISDGPVFIAEFSPLDGYILRQMTGIIVTSASILVLMSFLIWYLLQWVGKLRTIEQMKDDFSHNMTHELKTPVAVAYSAADSMLRYYDQSDAARNKQFLKIIMQRLSFLSGMIENILSMSMERFKTMKLNVETVAIKPILEEVAGMIELKAEKPVKIEIDVPDNLSVTADALHLGNVLSNLMDNAVKYSGESVNISIKADAGSLTVEDDGIGIDDKNLPYIFDKFYRATSGDRYEVGGYGLGLFYVKQIMDLFGWNIAVASKPGHGTKFIIKIKAQ